MNKYNISFYACNIIYIHICIFYIYERERMRMDNDLVVRNTCRNVKHFILVVKQARKK